MKRLSQFGRDEVTACLVTRGDVDLTRIVETLPWPNLIVWDNSVQPDMGAFGRYAAALRATTPLVYVQDDDTIVATGAQLALLFSHEPHEITSNMRETHNIGMPLLALPGWGAIFETALMQDAFTRWDTAYPGDMETDEFKRVGCDIVFPVLTRSRMIDFGHKNLAHAHAPNRTHLQPGYQELKHSYYDRAAALRLTIDAAAA